METEFQNAIGKSVGEVARDLSDFLQTEYLVGDIDLRKVADGFSMQEQLSFSLFMEAKKQGWSQEATENFYLRFLSPVMEEPVTAAMVSALRDPESGEFSALTKKYGSEFSLGNQSYWANCLSVGIDKHDAGKVLKYLQLFTVCLMEFSYMEDRRPKDTYVWGYYESFRKILELINCEGTEPQPITVRSVGGSAGAKKGDYYYLSLGIDIENSNPDRMAWGVSLDIVLKDAKGNELAVIADQINCIDPETVFHYGITRKVHGAPVAGISATAKASFFTKRKGTLMKGVSLSDIAVERSGELQILRGQLTNRYSFPLNGFTIYYQYLSADNKILGGGSECFFDSLPSGNTLPLLSGVEVAVKNAAKVVYSLDFDAKDVAANS